MGRPRAGWSVGQAARAPPGFCDPTALRDAVADVPDTLTGFARPLGAVLPGVAAYSFAAPSTSSRRPRGVPPTSLSALDPVSRPFRRAPCGARPRSLAAPDRTDGSHRLGPLPGHLLRCRPRPFDRGSPPGVSPPLQ